MKTLSVNLQKIPFTFSKINFLKNIKVSFLIVAIISGYITSITATASIWIDTQDPYLKSSIRALANGGYIKAPINTYPLMYKAIVDDIKAAKSSDVPSDLKFALRYVAHALDVNKAPHTKGIKVKGNSQRNDFQSFGEHYRAKGEINVFNEVIFDRWAFKTSVHFTKSADNDKKVNFEGSYLSTYIGNWVISLDQVSQWWGPGQDSAIILSNNAVAFPALRFTRHTSNAIDFPILNWLGPISMTTYFGRQEHSNNTKGIRTWGARFNFKPFNSLEIGLSRTAQWGGEGRINDFSTFVSLLIGEDNTTIDGKININNEPGNQLAGADFHWSSNLLDQSIGVYGEIIGEDEAGGLPSHIIYQLGMETFYGSEGDVTQVYLEYTNTFTNCYEGIIGSCAYEHHIYTEGYRRYQRAMGSTYDSDSEIITLSFNQSQDNDKSWYGKVKYMKLNFDDSNNNSFVHPVSEQAQKRIQIEGGFRIPIMQGLFNTEATLYQSTQINNNRKKIQGSIKASWEYHF